MHQSGISGDLKGSSLHKNSSVHKYYSSEVKLQCKYFTLLASQSLPKVH